MHSLQFADFAMFTIHYLILAILTVGFPIFDILYNINQKKYDC